MYLLVGNTAMTIDSLNCLAKFQEFSLIFKGLLKFTAFCLILSTPANSLVLEVVTGGFILSRCRWRQYQDSKAERKSVYTRMRP
jgi:hypothetical protein